MPRKSKLPTKAQQAAAESFGKMQQRLDALPKFGAKYPRTAKKKLLTQIEREKLILKERVKDARATPSLKTTKNATGKALPTQYEGDLKAREDKARKVKHAVGPIANKMGYGLITDPEHLKTMGRKV